MYSNVTGFCLMVGLMIIVSLNVNSLISVRYISNQQHHLKETWNFRATIYEL